MPRHLTALPLLASLGLATEHHFGAVTETWVLPPGGSEIEIWTTFAQRSGAFGQSMAQRLRLETGVGRAWQTSIYVDLETGLVRDSTGSIRSTGGLEGFALEFATRTSSADFGLPATGMVFELGVHPKAITGKWAWLVDFRAGDWVFATNLAAQPAWIFDARPERESSPMFDSLPFDWSAGTSWAWTPELRVGGEILDHNEFTRRDDASSDWIWRSSNWYAGPDVTFVVASMWLHLGALFALGDVASGQDSWSAKLVGGVRL